MKTKENRHIALLGGGPAALFMYKRLVENGTTDLHITIFERRDQLGAGMPYSVVGACNEHVTNVSDNEIPEIVTTIKEWIRTAPADLLKAFDMKPELFNEYKVVPRLLFGKYLEAQFDLLQTAAKKAGIQTTVLYDTAVMDVADEPDYQTVKVVTANEDVYRFDAVVMCTGHHWPKKFEDTVPGWFDSPYPPSKLAQTINYPVAIKGSSLTAIDAVRTLARSNGSFSKNEDSTLTYAVAKDSEGFRLVMHSLGGYLPAIRFHLADTHLSPGSAISEEEVYDIKAANGGFISLDYLFDRNFKQPLKEQNPEFYETMKEMSLEEFVAHMMTLRDKLDAFTLFKAEYAEAEKSIKRRQSVAWKETLASLSYAMNYPAKHLSAEDMLRLKKVLQPLISIVIAFVPQTSCRELLALYDAGVLSLVPVDKESRVEPAQNSGCVYTYTDEEGKEQVTTYPVFVDAVGQPAFQYNEFPFKSLKKDGTVSAAHLQFRSAEEGKKEMEKGNALVRADSNGNFYLQVPGISINDHFQVLDGYGAYNNRIYIMAVPYIGGLNPDYSGLDFCEAASERIAKVLLQREGKKITS